MFLNIFEENFKKHADKKAIEFLDPPQHSLTYAQLDRAIQTKAGWLFKTGLRPGERIALQLPKCLDFILLYLAALQNAVAVGWDPQNQRGTR